ncbi:MAG: GntR family transcriptional regulator [Eubacteriales bacterium]|nr:GntR family transcriptional regulator [Eubacteriales bacterium]
MYLTERLPRETGREYALRVIKENIINLELAPGSMVSEKDLAAEMGLSRTPVREALIELAKGKIVEIYPQKGSAVAKIDYNLVEEARFMRGILEDAVVQLVCTTAAPEQIHKLEENVKLQEFYLVNEDDRMLLELDNQFHEMLFEIARKRQVYELMQNITIHFDRVRSMSLQVVKDTKVVQDHQVILEAIRQQSPEEASKAMERHLSRYIVDEAALREKYEESYFK